MLGEQIAPKEERSVLRYAPSHAQGARWGARLPRSVRSPQTKKRRSSERRNKDWSGHKGLMDALRAPLPLRLKSSGEFLKTAHWAVFLTEFHLIGSSPAPCSKNGKRSSIALKPLSPQRQRAEAGCPRLPRRMAKRTSVRAEPCTRGKMGCPASAQRQVASNEKAPFVRTAQ